ncbi:MAG: class I SAM-dependent methyltransferase [Solirubrobacteraceae bacterium]
MPWHARARALAQRLGLDPRYVRRLRWVSKARAVRRVGAPVHRHLRFVLTDPEPDNFTYELANQDELAAWVQAVSGCSEAEAGRVLAEPDADPVLRARLLETAGHRRWWSKPRPPFGKRRGWYALARLTRPGLIVESGVHDGLGSLLLLRALELNTVEGADGRLVSFDVNPAAGWIAGSDPRWALRIESSRTGLPALLAGGETVGMFIHDSLHTYEHERWELATAGAQLAADGVLISDNVHVTPALSECSAELGLDYHEFVEQPVAHFYPGAAMGAARHRPSSSR